MKKYLDDIIVEDKALADICITTGHASKGLEYDEVTIVGDLLQDPEDIESLWSNESLTCLLFVMISRARVRVNYPDYLQFLENV